MTAKVALTKNIHCWWLLLRNRKPKNRNSSNRP